MQRKKLDELIKRAKNGDIPNEEAQKILKKLSSENKASQNLFFLQQMYFLGINREAEKIIGTTVEDLESSANKLYLLLPVERGIKKAIGVLKYGMDVMMGIEKIPRETFYITENQNTKIQEAYEIAVRLGDSSTRKEAEKIYREIMDVSEIIVVN